MELLVCMIIGYLLGSLSPAALLSKIKHTNLREHGTGNLGATNTMLTFGLRYGLFVMVFDALKAITAFGLARILFPDNPLSGLAAGLAAPIGHMFPFYLRFNGGKGLAAFGGCILAYDPAMFLLLFVLCVLLMLITNHSAVVPITSSALFSIFSTLKTKNLAVFLLTSCFSLIIIHRHKDNILKITNGDDADIRGYFREKLSK